MQADDAVAALRADMQHSLHARIELAAEEAGLLGEESDGSGSSGSSGDTGSAWAGAGPAAAAGGRGAAVVLSLPRRAFLQVPGSLPYSEYLGQGEGAEVAAARLVELLGPEVAGGAAPACREAEWQPGSAAAVQLAAGKAAASACSVMAMAAGAAAVLVAMAWLQMSS